MGVNAFTQRNKNERNTMDVATRIMIRYYLLLMILESHNNADNYCFKPAVEWITYRNDVMLFSQSISVHQKAGG